MSRRLGQRRFDGWLNEYQPDLILIHQPIWPLEQVLLDQTNLRHGYRPLRAFEFPAYSKLLLLQRRPAN
jgi:hypothetical protein